MNVRYEEELPILEMQDISKRFPGVLALDKANLSIRRGEIHSLIGQNGAGKSTMMKILAGMYTSDDGVIRLDGQAVSFKHPREALHKGIVTVYQELSLLPNLTVAENMFLGRELGNRLIVDNLSIRNRSIAILDELGIHNIDVDANVATIPLANRHLIEIAKALSHDLKVLILDEPTAPLTNDDTIHLFEILKRIRDKGVSIIFITHRLKEVLTYCDRGTILRNGQTIKTIEIGSVTENDIIELMIGQQLESFYRPVDRAQDHPSEIALEVSHLNVGKKIQDVSFNVTKGEIIGITGLLGAGQNELVRALFGIQEDCSGLIQRNGRTIQINNPREAVDNGICLLTENRKEEGLFLEMTVKENITLPSISSFQRSKFIPLIDQTKEQQSAQEFVDKVDIVLRSQKSKIRTLSGGNQQKSIVARWLLRDLEVLLFIEPTRGIDVGAKAEIYRLLSSLAAQGKAIVVVSTDHIEILGISDRIFVMYQGKIRKIFTQEGVTEELLLSEIQGGNSYE
ncbi:MAG: sugar ABC transporter ATP-binding protein [Anaerolineaceae bacterium]|nr:sugar ABC transporter ATP-binding protein [Anaerolineaceae bacterium]